MKTERRKFAKNSIMFIILFLSILIIFNSLYDNYVFKEKNINRNYVQFQESNKETLKIMFFGDSHPAFAVNPEFINNSFNFAVPGETYEQTYYKVRYIIENYPQVEVFVLPYDLHSFSNYRSDSYIEYNHWLHFLSIEELSKLTSKSEMGIRIESSIVFLGKIDEIISFFKNDQTKMFSGWQKITANFTSKSNLSKVGVDRVNLQFKKDVDLVNFNLSEDFFNTIKLLEDNNKTIILVKYPLTKQYTDAIESFGINRTKVYAYFDERLKAHNVEVLDYQDYFKYNISIFSNSDHLNYYGSEVFSKVLNSELNDLLSFKHPETFK